MIRIDIAPSTDYESDEPRTTVGPFDVTCEENGVADSIAYDCPTMQDALISLHEWVTNRIANES